MRAPPQTTDDANDTRVLRARGVRFLVVGGLCFLLSATVLGCLVELSGWHHVPALVVSILMGNVLGWSLNRWWTYGQPDLSRTRQGVRMAAREITRYIAVNLATMTASVLSVHAMVAGLNWNYGWSSMGVAVLVAAANFVLHGRYTFTEREPQSGKACSADRSA